MANDWEQYRERYEPARIETYDAYVDVWRRDAGVARTYADWNEFARCADADMAMVRAMPDLVRQAEMLMSRNGYRLSAGGGRRWQHTKGEVRTTSANPVRAPRGAQRPTARKPATPRTARPKAPAAPPKPPPRPRVVECPNDPGMMVPLEGSCMCGWSPADAD